MTYTLMTAEQRWKIDAVKFDQLNRWQLFVAGDTVWMRVNYFPTAEAAMEAVASGATGVEAWDAERHNRADFEKEKWSTERW
ncbi:MAG: hypothetical protein Q7S40_09045 [Opitutaceae bacterium]|nr:hypothetical protein [Opitutaceae bacterium]